MNKFKVTLLFCTLICFYPLGAVQSADENSDSGAPEGLLAQKIESRSQLVEKIAAQHLLGRLKADEFIAQQKFGLARHNLRLAQRALISGRDDIPQSIFTFLETLGREKLSAIDRQELIFLRKRVGSERAERAKLASRVPQAGEARATEVLPLARPRPSAAKPVPTVRLAPGVLRYNRKNFRTRLSVIQYDDTPLGDVLDDLRAKTGANIVANWQSLANFGVDRTTAISLNLRNVPAEKVLKIVLQNLSNAYARISYIIQDDVVFIASGEDLDMIFELRVYEIADLLMETQDKRGGPQFEAGGYNSGRSDGQRPNNRDRPGNSNRR